jgi:hypothetical protein
MTTVPTLLTRQQALESLTEFASVAKDYASKRNYSNFSSGLSGFIRRRLVTEKEVICALLEKHSFGELEKFIQEVCWRTYWKGYLEHHPEVWHSYQESLKTLPAINHELIKNTDLSFFNEWVVILENTGFLHNHIRMWFASVWIHTLKLPWQQGAEFMFERLIDADPASNTLSWRWVAGLHTKGKRYLAEASNIATFSNGRWTPKASELDMSPEPINEEPLLQKSHPSAFTTSLITCDAIIATIEDLSSADAIFIPDKSGLNYECALHRSHELNIPLLRNQEVVNQWASQFQTVGVLSPNVGSVGAELIQNSPGLTAVFSEWDRKLYPLATKGFFPYWEKAKSLVPNLLTSVER